MSPIKIDTKSFKSVAKGDKLVPHLDRIIGKEDFPWTFDYTPKVDDDAWHPSSDCTPSLRELYLKAKGELPERPITHALRKTFIVGHFWHQYIQHLLTVLEFAKPDAIERVGFKAWGNEPFTSVVGTADVAPLILPGDHEYLLDIKTMNGHDFRGQNAPAWAVDKWECQVNIYMDFFDFERAMILGVMKDSPHDFREFHFERNQPLIDALYHKWKLVSACLKEEVEPPGEESIELPLKGVT